jgi:hypothetical protein
MAANDSIPGLKATQRKNALRTGWILLSVAAVFFAGVMVKFAFFMR